jgi:hypothetical protein
MATTVATADRAAEAARRLSPSGAGSSSGQDRTHPVELAAPARLEGLVHTLDPHDRLPITVRLSMMVEPVVSDRQAQ